jgi:hypothetical protein
VPVVPGGGQGHEALPRQKRQAPGDDPGRNGGAVPTRDVTLAGALLHGDFAVVKWLVAHVVVSQSVLASQGVQNVKMV